MKNKLEKYSNQRLRKRIIYTCIRDFGVEETAEMLGMGFDSTSLVYAYSNKEEVHVPNDRWKRLKWALSLKGDKRAIKDEVDPRVFLVLKNCADIETNGSTHDELSDMIRELGEVEEHLKENPEDALTDIKQMRGILDRYEAEIRGMK